MKSFHKLALGTVQFGFNYGISNTHGIMPYERVSDILKTASLLGIDTIDTAHSYGVSETFLGKYFQANGCQFKVISKIKCNTSAEVETIIANSLSDLGVKQFYGYLFHDFLDFKRSPEIFETLMEQRSAGKMKKIGFSLYHPHELDSLLEKKVPFEIIQVPYSFFDRRFERFFPMLKQRGVEVHVRSVFLQGIIYRDPETLSSFFNPIKPKLELLEKIAKNNNLSKTALAIKFAHSQPQIDKVVIGVHTADQLREDVLCLEQSGEVENIHEILEELSINDESILVPKNWPV